MIKFWFGLSAVGCLILLIKILKIFLNDFHRLTEYGFGYLAGLNVLFLVFLIFSVYTGRKLLKKQAK